MTCPSHPTRPLLCWKLFAWNIFCPPAWQQGDPLSSSSSQLDPEMELSEQPLFVTDPQHIAIQHETETRRYEVEGGEEKLNGNNVVLEKEMVKSNEISNKLDRISNIYNKTRAMLKQVASGK
jgi:flagellar basal body rod protein FlgB